MNYINRAINNVTRKLSKSIILMLTFFVIGNFVVIGLGVSDASSKAKVLTRQKMRAVINFEVDYDRWFQDVTDYDTAKYPYISNELIEKIIADKRVSTLNAITADIVYANGFESVPLNNKRENENSSNDKSCYIDESGQEICRTYEEPNITLQGNAFPQMIEFVDGIYNLKEGNMFTADDIAQGKRVALITDTLAQHNNLRIGDSISITIVSKSDIDDFYGKRGVTEEDIAINFEIVGIFDNTKEAGPNLPNFDWMSRYESPENVIVVPDKAIYETRYNMAIKMWDWGVEHEPNDYNQNPDNKPSLDEIAKKGSITVLLNDPLKVDEFVEEYTESIPKEDFIKLDANNETFKKLAKPLDTLSLYASFIVWLVVVNAVIIISLVTALTLKTREFEIGVLLAMGVSKLKIVLQFFLELAIVAVVGFTLAVISGSLMAKKVGQTVLNYQVSQSDVNVTDDDSNSWFFEPQSDYFTDVTIDDLTSNYEVSISPIIIGQIYVAGLGIVLIAILIPSLMIMRFNPKRILMSAQ